MNLNEIVTIGGVLVIATARFFFADLGDPFICDSDPSDCNDCPSYLPSSAAGTGRVDFGIPWQASFIWAGSVPTCSTCASCPRAVVVDVRPAHRLGGDTGAYSIGAAYGKHKMTPRLSPKKAGRAILPVFLRLCL
jgi:hypothetical protein